MYKFKPPQWMPSWQQKYSGLLVEGLTDGPTYVRLSRKSLDALDVVLAFRPLVSRVTSDTIVIGGKLSVFPVKESIKAEPASDAVMVTWLLGAYPELSCQKRSVDRVGTLVAALYQADVTAGKVFIDQWGDTDHVEKMLDHIVEISKTEIENRKLVSRALKEALRAEMPVLFSDVVQNPKAKVDVTATTFNDGEKVVDLIAYKQAEELSKAVSAALLEEKVPPESLN